jgi:hypothetical protein
MEIFLLGDGHADYQKLPWLRGVLSHFNERRATLSKSNRNLAPVQFAVRVVSRGIH